MNLATELYGYAAFFIVVPTWLVCSAFLRSRRHLCTTINALLMGLVPFMGFSSLAFAWTADDVQIPYANYKTIHFWKMAGSMLLFLAMLLLAYSKARAPRGVREFLGRKPNYTPWQPVMVTIIGAVVAIFCLLPQLNITIPVVSQIMVRCLSSASVFAGIFSFAVWWRDRSNPVAIGLFAGVFAFSVILAVTVGVTRRPLLGVLLAIGVVIYWSTYQRVSRVRMLATLGVLILGAMVVLNAYSTIRTRSLGHAVKGANAIERGIYKIRRASESLGHVGEFDAKMVSELGQNATNASLYSIYLSENMASRDRFSGLDYPSYLHSTLYVIANPIPRVFWKDKPLSLGYMLARYKFPFAKVTWGPGLAGHFYHEGGMIVAAFYGLLLGTLLKWVDEVIVSDPDNLFLKGLFAAMVPQLLLLPRGDLGNAMLNIAFCFVTFWVIRFLAMRTYGLHVPDVLSRQELQPV